MRTAMGSRGHRNNHRHELIMFCVSMGSSSWRFQSTLRALMRKGWVNAAVEGGVQFRVLQGSDAPGCCGPVPSPSQFCDALEGLRVTW